MKKLVILLLVALLAVGLLIGCSNEEPADKNNVENTEAITDSNPADTKPETQPEETKNNPETVGGDEEKVNVLDGKKVIFIGNSYTYYGKTVLEKTQSILTQNARINDKGFFYQLCKANGAEVSVTNWTFGGHGLGDLLDKCSADRGCDGVEHLSYLVDRNYDYVVIQEGSGVANNVPEFKNHCERFMQIFRDVNPNTKFVFLVQSQAHIKSYRWLPEIKELENKGVTIVDWGAVVYDIMTGKVTVPGATQTYNKNSFIVCKSASDGFHPNMLTGYITTLMTYCAITGESAVGQDYSFCNNSRINTAFNFSKFVDKYYTYDNATTNFPDVFESESDMTGIQTLVDKYLTEKPYLKY